MTGRATALVGLGANLGDPLASLREAVARLRGGAVDDTTVIGCSSVYESRAIGAPGPNYRNAAVALDTSRSPAEVLAGLHAIEHAMGRIRRERWESRVIDLDLLAWIPAGENTSVDMNGAVELPHPRLVARDFVLVPLMDLWPGLVVGGRPIAEHLAALSPGGLTIVGRGDDAVLVTP